jgi:hypothetical protein
MVIDRRHVTPSSDDLNITSDAQGLTNITMTWVNDVPNIILTFPTSISWLS